MFGKQLKELREANGLYQKDLAKILNVGSTTVTEWEKGNNQPSLEMIVQIAAFFNESTDYLLGVSDYSALNVAYREPKKYNSEMVGLINDVKDMSEKEIAHIRGMVDYYKIQLEQARRTKK